MKRLYIPIIFAAAALTSCSVYKNSQTPDDVYYSPGTPKQAVANSSNNPGGNNEYYSTQNDQYVQMKVQDPARWSYFDDYNYDYYSPYSAYGFSPYYASTMGYGMCGMYGMNAWIGFGYYSPFTYWNSYYTWNGLYNPYYYGVVVVNPKVPASTQYTQLRTFNPSSYSNNFYNRGNNPLTKTAGSSQPYTYSQTIHNNYNTPNSNTLTRSSFFNRTPNSNFNSQPVRTFSSPSFGGGGGGVRFGGGGGGISRPGR